MTPARVPASRLRTAALLAVALLGATAAPAAASDSLITVLDNSHADSILEVDRTAGIQQGSEAVGSTYQESAVSTVKSLVSAQQRQDGDD